MFLFSFFLFFFFFLKIRRMFFITIVMYSRNTRGRHISIARRMKSSIRRYQIYVNKRKATDHIEYILLSAYLRVYYSCIHFSNITDSRKEQRILAIYLTNVLGYNSFRRSYPIFLIYKVHCPVNAQKPWIKIKTEPEG